MDELLNTPLDDNEFQELDDFLASDAVGDSGMDMSMLDGFLTAIAIGPGNTPPSEWLPRVWGQEEMVWESKAQAERILGYVFRHLNNLAAIFREDPESFTPLTYFREDEVDGETVEIEVIDDWCYGFVDGISLDADAWQPLLESEEDKALIFPIFLYGTDAGFEELKKNEELAARQAEFAEALPGCIIGIAEYWQPYRAAQAGKMTVRHETPPPGRNDPCPCGSGKKFKKCCGSPEKLN